MKPTFSIIIPVYNRSDVVFRAINSLFAQTYDPSLFEVIIIDDGSTDDLTKKLWEQLYQRRQDGITIGPMIMVHRFPENQGRLAARNKGLELSSNEWICWLDSDDEYISTYLEVFAKAINENPNAKIFTAGTVVYDEQNLCSHLRDAFMPGLRPDGRGCLPFKSGGVSTGGFVFNAGLARGLGLLPEAKVPYGSPDSFPAVATQKYPELGTLYGQNESGQWLPLGNPWGDDYVMFFALTRENVPIKLNYHGYLQHVRHG